MADRPAVLDEQAVIARLAAELPQWELRDGWIRRKFTTGGWPYTLMLVNTIGFLAEAAWHHSDLSVSWAEVHVKLRTHKSDGITENDFELAAMIERHAMWRPDDGQALAGFEAGFKKKWVR